MADSDIRVLLKPETPTIEPSGGEQFGMRIPTTINDDKALEIVQTLQTYKDEAQEARRAGLNPRDDKWRENLDLYWNRHDFSRKATWQAKETLPEVPGFVDRFAAALKEALISTPEGFYTVSDPADKENDLGQAIKRMTDIWLDQAGRNQVGQLLPFSAVFEEQMKLGALMATSAVVTWKNDGQFGRVAVETQDPQNVWLDHTNRNLYRFRRIELDRHELASMVKAKDGANNPIFNLDEIDRLVSNLTDDERQRREELTGTGQQVSSTRRPIVLDEYVATVVGNDGSVIADRSLMVVANDKYLVRGPEKNPFWHGKDWLVYSPLIVAPMSVYGRSYMEDFGSLSKTFTELTNMLLDAVHTSSLRAYAMVPGMLLNPEQVADGITPHKLFLLEDGYDPKQFASALELGVLPAESLRMWEMLKSELGEAAQTNEIGMGQFAPNSRTSATEVLETKQSSSALIRSIAQTVETRFLDPTLDLIWKTGMQHVSPKDTVMQSAAGPEMFQALIKNRRNLVSRPVTFKARGISSLIGRGQTMKALATILSLIGQNDVLMQNFLQKVDLQKLIGKLFELNNVDLSQFTVSEREQAIRAATEGANAAGERTAGAGPASPQADQEMSSVARLAGIGR
jgi:hypothetical protein